MVDNLEIIFSIHWGRDWHQHGNFQPEQCKYNYWSPVKSQLSRSPGKQCWVQLQL